MYSLAFIFGLSRSVMRDNLLLLSSVFWSFEFIHTFDRHISLSGLNYTFSGPLVELSFNLYIQWYLMSMSVSSITFCSISIFSLFFLLFGLKEVLFIS